MENRMILTTEGVKRMQDITPGYYVYSYDDGHPLMIKEVEPITTSEIIQIESHDGRSQIMTWDEYCILANHNKIPFKEITFDEHRPRVTKHPDPYTAGFIFCSTKLNEEELSVRSNAFNYMTAPIRKYHIERGRTENGQTYLKWESDHQDLTWKNFFLGHHFDPSSKYTCIPFAYQYGSHADRMQFIQGVFDAGLDYGFNKPWDVTIVHESREFIQAIQRMLWSLNIPSSLTYRDGEFILAADTSREISANFYYNEEFIRQCLSYDEIALHPDNVLYDEVRYLNLSEPVTTIIPKLYEKGVLYVDVNYMPIASC